jgi:small subunit ribosomal protein S6
MVLQENKQLRDYELVVILNPELAEDGIETLVGRVSKYVTDNGGIVDSVDKWGKKRLAYPLKHSKEGFYFLARFKLQPKYTKELESSLMISEEVLRHLLTKIES